MKRFVFSCVLAGLMGSTGLSAQSTPAVNDAPVEDKQSGDEKEVAPGIVVRGDRLPDKKINRYIYDILRPQAAGDTDQYPRLNEAFCPSVIGFGENVNAAIDQRMRRVAKVAGIPVEAEADCNPNMHLVRVEDGPKMIKLLRQKRARQAFGWMPIHQRSGLERLPGPAFSWQQTLPFSAQEGLAIPTGNTPGIFGGEPASNYVAPGCSNPRLCLPIELSFRHAVVLIERAALDDVSVIQMADYALMRGLAQVREDRFRRTARDADTILNLFDESVPVDERMPSIGRMDLAMLTALYAAPDNVDASRQRGRMVKTFRAVLEDLD